MNWKKPVWFCYAMARGYQFPSLVRRYLREYLQGVGAETRTQALHRLLAHCAGAVPYYRGRLRDIGFDPEEREDPYKYLAQMPILTRGAIRANFKQIQSADLCRRKWRYTTSKGSSGEPIRLIQDSTFEDRSGAVSRFFHLLLGCEAGEPLVRLWCSERDLEQETRSVTARVFNWLTNTRWLNACRMPPERMRQLITQLNRGRPRLIVAYAQAAYELARFAERERIPVRSQEAMVTSAGPLYHFMRQKIEEVFGCDVYNLYGSREVGAVACELPGLTGMWVAPWANFVEILDDDGRPVDAGEEGNLVVTCLTNYAMPLLRYWTGDRGALLPEPRFAGPPGVQVLGSVSGRSVDLFRTRDRAPVDGEYFAHLLCFRPWVRKFQVVQKQADRVVFKIVLAGGHPAQSELDTITARTRSVLGADCQVDFEFPADLPPQATGKYRYTVCELAA